MPNRIIKESICTSDTIDGLSWFEEVFFYRLMVNVDDYGRFDARPAILKARLFPLKANVTEKNVEQTLNRLATAGLVSTYTVKDKPILQLLTWEKHQQIRNTKSKYPGPDEADLKSTEISCNQLKSDEINCPRNPIQSNPNPNPIREGDKPPDTPSKPSKPARNKYGQYQNVLLTEDEYTTLAKEFPIDGQERIERLSEYIASKGVTYKNHLATIRAWARKDKAAPVGKRVGFQAYDKQADHLVEPAVPDLLAEARNIE